MLKKLLKEIFKQKGIYLLLFVGIFDQLLMVSLPYFAKIFIEFIEKGNIGNEFYKYLTLAMIISISAVGLGFIANYIKKGISTRFEIVKNIYYFKKFFALDFAYRNSEGTGRTITKINRGIDAQVSLFNSIIEAIFIILVRASFILIIIFTVYKSIIAIVILITIFLYFFSKYIGNKLKPLTEQEQYISEQIGRQTNKMIMESNLIKVSNKEDYEINKLDNIFKPLPKLRQKIWVNNNISYDIMHLFFQLLEYSCYLIIGLLIIKSQMTIGELFLIVTYIWWLWWPISIVMTNATEYRNQISKYEALENFINQENKIIDGNNIFKPKSGEINIENIDFGYNDERLIFKNFNLKIDGGFTTALVGHSGSGKSTIIKLILRNYLVDNGSIKVDGQDLKDLKIETFYQNIGYLSQEPAVFDGTIRENLMYGLNTYSKEKNTPIPSPFPLKEKGNENQNDYILWEALKKVDLYDLIKDTKYGLETEVGEKGLKLSGGERQRISLARIFLSNPKILILDEPTSALDSISENKVTNIIKDLMKDKTVIVIAHRLQTVMGADKIIVLEKGKIIETGNHTELLSKDGVYASLVDLQRGILKE